MEKEGIRQEDLSWCIVADEAVQWDWEYFFSERGWTLQTDGKWDLSHVCSLLSGEFDFAYQISEQEGDGKKLSVFFPDRPFDDQPPRSEALSESRALQTSGLVEKGQELLEEMNEDEITDFARIIKEKYERMKGHE